MTDKKLHIILDLDETLLHFVKPRSLWDKLSKEIKTKYRISDSGKDGLFILRPYLKEFLSFLFKNKKIDVSIWTWSDAVYAMDVANMLTDNEPELFAHIWSSNDAEMAENLHGKGKDLNFLWYGSTAEGAAPVPGFMPCNTILIDDLDDNVSHPSNNRNAIQVPAFAPFGLDKPRKAPYNDSNARDSALLNVIDVITSVSASPDFCRDGDLPHPFKSLKKVPRNRVTVGRGRKTKQNRYIKRTTLRRVGGSGRDCFEIVDEAIHLAIEITLNKFKRDADSTLSELEEHTIRQITLSVIDRTDAIAYCEKVSKTNPGFKTVSHIADYISHLAYVDAKPIVCKSLPEKFVRICNKSF